MGMDGAEGWGGGYGVKNMFLEKAEAVRGAYRGPTWEKVVSLSLFYHQLAIVEEGYTGYC